MRHASLLQSWRLGLGLLALGYAVAAGAGESAAARLAQPLIEPASKGSQCVEPVADMRRNHMDYLKHQRDDTLRGGVRGAKYSLKACIECHASTTTQSVAAAPTNFCVSCHSYAAVKIDCFECHATQAVKSTSLLPLVHPSGTLAELSRKVQQVAAPAASAKQP